MTESIISLEYNDIKNYVQIYIYTQLRVNKSKGYIMSLKLKCPYGKKSVFHVVIVKKKKTKTMSLGIVTT